MYHEQVSWWRRRYRLPSGGVLAWSSDGAWLVVGAPGRIRDSLLTGRTAPIRVAGGADWTLSGITRTGRLWLFPNPERRMLALVDPHTGTMIRRLTITVPPDLRADEQVPVDGLAFGPRPRDDAEMLFPIQVRRRESSAAWYAVSEDMLAVSPRTGRPVRRYNLPSTTVRGGRRSGTSGTTSWRC